MNVTRISANDRHEDFLIFKKTPPIYRISEIYPRDGWSLLSLTHLIE